MKRVLVLSDNAMLVSHFQLESKKYVSSGIASFQYFYSPSNASYSELQLLGLSPINIKKPCNYNWLIDNFNLILSLHCKQIFPDELVKRVLCINVHPGFNPYNRGWYPQVFSIINGYPVGATIHVMDELVDHGAIIDQKIVQIRPEDTSLEVYNRVIEIEKELITKNIGAILDGSYIVYVPGTKGNYNSIEDFKRLCKLDLDEFGTLGQHINLLRALTHGDFQNAYFELNGKRHYISIKITSN